MTEADKKLILIADPDSRPDSPLHHVLEASNYRVVNARSADMAWASLISRSPDLVILEPVLPNGIEGFHIVWKLRDFPDRRLSRTPILIVSRIHQVTKLNMFPHFHDGHYRIADFLPVQGFLDKPVDDRFLVDKIDLILSSTVVDELVGRRAA